jgi:hypothetical protein
VLTVPPTAAPYRASGLVRWHFSDMARCLTQGPLRAQERTWKPGHGSVIAGALTDVCFRDLKNAVAQFDIRSRLVLARVTFHLA